MSEPRSPRDRLRAIRAGRVSQLVSGTPTDGLPPTEPPRLTLNGKPVTTGAAFDAVMARAHNLKVDEALNTIMANTVNKSSKQRISYPPGGYVVPLPPSPFTVPITPLVALTVAPLIGGLGVEMATRKDLNNILRQLSDEAIDLSHLLRYPSNDNDRSTAYTPVDVDMTPSPTPTEAPQLPNKHTGPLLDDPEMRDLGKTPPFPGESLELLDRLPPKDWDEFNQPQIESIPIFEIDAHDLILKHNSSPETQEDTRYALSSLKRQLLERGALRAADWTRETELYIPNAIDGTRKGSRFADLGVAIIVDGETLIVPYNVVDVLMDGLTPDARERRARDDINRYIPYLKERYAQLNTLPKSRGMVRAEWEAKVDAIIADQLDALFTMLGL